MKKYLLILFLFIGIKLYAQENNKLGIRNGITFSTIESVYVYDPIVVKKGFVSKLYLEFFNNTYWSLQTGFGFVQKGYSTIDSVYVIDTLTLYEMKSNEQRDFLTIDLLCKIKYSFGKLTPYVLVGPKIDFLVGKWETRLENPEFYSQPEMYFGLDYSAGISYKFNYFDVLVGYKREKMFYFHDATDKDISSQVYVDILIPLTKNK